MTDTPQQQSPDPVSSEREDELDLKLQEQFISFMEQVEEWQSNLAGMPSEHDMMLLNKIYADRIDTTKQLLAPSSTSPVTKDILELNPTKPCSLELPVGDENEPIVEMISPYPFVYEVKPEDIERPTHKHWVCVRGKYMVDYDHLIQSAVAQVREEVENELGFDEDAESRQIELCNIVENKGIVYMSLQTGRIISEEDYLEFEEWVSSVGKPPGSIIEQYLKIDIAQQLNTLRSSEA